jgi:hypothetical protein
VVEAVFVEEEFPSARAAVFQRGTTQQAMSPPAQNPRDSLGSPSGAGAWSMITAVIAGSSRQASSASVIALTIGRVSAWIARGRLSERMPAAPSRRTMTSGVIAAGPGPRSGA